MGSSSKQTVGYRYLMDLLMGYGRGQCDAIRRIRIGGRDAWSGNVTGNAVIRINKPDLFGGDSGMGGVVGDLHIQMGASDQPRHSLIVGAFGPLTSALRGICSGFFSGQICAMNPNPEQWEVQRTTILKGWDGDVPWYPEKATILPEGLTVPAMNPAHILMKVLLHRDCGRGLPMARIDVDSYAAAADTLHAEGLGLCIRWSRQSRVSEFLQEVCDHIGASQYISRSTGKLTIALARGGYNVEDLPLFTEDTGLLALEDDDSPAGAGATNEIIVKWMDPQTGDDRQIRWQNSAAIQAYGRVSETRTYPGIPTAKLAARVAQRDGEILSSGAKRFTVVLDRRGGDIQPAGLFRISVPSEGIGEMVLRAGDIQDGTLLDGRIRIAAMQDVFGLDATSYVAETPGGYVPPDRTPQASSIRRLLELNYRNLAVQLGTAVNALDPTATGVMLLAQRPNGLALNFDLSTRAGSAAFSTVDQGDWCPTAQLVAQLAAGSAVAANIAFTGGADLEQVDVGDAAVVDNEVFRVDAIDLATSRITLARGCADSVPALHLAGARIWFPDSGAGVDPTEYLSGETVSAKALTRTSAGVLDVAVAPTDTLALTNRQVRPYPPARLRINGEAYPVESWGTGGVLTAAWAHRDRLLQGDQLVDSDATSIGPEPGTSYVARWYLDNVLVRTSPATSGLDDSYTPPAGSGGKTIRVEIESLRDSIACWQRLTHTFLYRAQLVTETGDRIVTEEGNPIILE